MRTFSAPMVKYKNFNQNLFEHLQQKFSVINTMLNTFTKQNFKRKAIHIYTPNITYFLHTFCTSQSINLFTMSSEDIYFQTCFCIHTDFYNFLFFWIRRYHQKSNYYNKSIKISYGIYFEINLIYSTRLSISQTLYMKLSISSLFSIQPIIDIRYND